MKEYEVIVETANPCGGFAYADRQIIEIEAESPEAYVATNGRYPVIDKSSIGGDIIITTGDGKGNIVRYTFSE